MTINGYPENTNTWLIGSIVLYVYDAKHPNMYMQVVGYTRDGLCKTQYVDRQRKRTIWRNELKYLLTPALFGLTGKENAVEYERVRLWNYYCPIGTQVTGLDALAGDVPVSGVTRSEAWLLNGNVGMVLLENHIGGYLLKYLKKSTAETETVVSNGL